MSISRLITKELGTSIHNFRAKNILNYNLKNKEIATVDFVKGFSEKKGNFEVYSFRDVRGKLIGRETIYGNMKISLSKVEDGHITFRLKNGDISDNNKYYLIEDAVCAYPLKNVLLSNNLWKYNNEVGYGIMNYDIPIETLYENAREYSTNGVFTFNEDDRKFYVIAVTSNNLITSK